MVSTKFCIRSFSESLTVGDCQLFRRSDLQLGRHIRPRAGQVNVDRKFGAEQSYFSAISYLVRLGQKKRKPVLWAVWDGVQRPDDWSRRSDTRIEVVD